MNKIKAGIGTVAALGVIYIGGVWFFGSHVMPGTSINGMKASFMKKSEVPAMLNESLSAYKIAVTERDFSEVLSDFGLSIEEEEVLKELEESPYTWPLAFSDSRDKEVDFVYDEAKVRSNVKKLKCFSAAQEPVNAEVAYKGGKYVINEEIYGYKPADSAALLAKVEEAVLGLEESIDLTEDFLNPTVLADDEKVAKAAEAAQAYMDLGIYYKFGSKTEKLTNDIMADFLQIEDYKVELDKDAVKEYVQSLADKYDTCYTQRYFTTHSGKKITIKKGDYGWWTNTAESTEALYEKIEAKEGGQAEIVYRQTAESYDGNDYGNTYVEVSISAQTLWLYKDGKCILSTPVTTGNVNKGRGTPKGIYAITYKTKDHRMVGEDYDVNVTYWMPFCGNVGLHDATWRRTFGGNHYLTSGSHGCVNIPLAATKKIYNNVKKFTAVILY